MHTILDERDKMKFDEELKSIEDNVIVVSKTGEVLNVNDGADEPLKGLIVLGKTEQIPVVGNQLLRYPFVQTSKVENGVTFTDNGDGSIHLKGTTSTTEAYFNFWQNTDGKRLWLKAGTYTISASAINAVKIGGNIMDDEGNRLVTDGILLNSNRLQTTVTIDKDGGMFLYVYAEKDKTVDETVHVMVNAGSTALPWEPYVDSPSPEYPQELVSVGKDGNVEVGLYGENLLDAHSFILHTNKTLDVSDDGYTIVCTGGSDNGYRYSVIYLDVNALIGKTIYLTADSIVPNNIKGVQLNVFYDNDSTKYHSMEKGGEIESLYVSEHVTRIALCIYSNNNLAALDTDNTITVKGLRLTLEKNTSWTPYKQKQSLTISTPNGLPGVPVTDASLATYTDENGQMHYADEVDFERKVYIQRVYRLICDGSENWRTAYNDNPDGNRLEISTRNLEPLSTPVNANDYVVVGALCNALRYHKTNGHPRSNSFRVVLNNTYVYIHKQQKIVLFSTSL